jgi:hypothetical protein
VEVTSDTPGPPGCSRRRSRKPNPQGLESPAFRRGEEVKTPQWRKAKRSEEVGACVELAGLPHSVGVRDSKAPEEGHLELNPAAFAGLVGRIKAGELDR